MVDRTRAHQRRRLDLVWPALLAVVTLLASAPVASASVAPADGRVALVGNRTYLHIARLPNSENDTADMAAALCAAGPTGAHPPGVALAIDEGCPDQYRFQPQAALRGWQFSSGAQAMSYHDSAAGTSAAVSPAYPAASPRLAAFAAPAAQLPPEILVDRHLVRVDRLLADDDYGAALAVMDEIVALQQQHDLLLPEEFHFRYAEVALAAGLAESALASVNEYLVTAGREGDFYRQALRLLDDAEETLRRAEAERRRAEAERQRVEAERQRAEVRQREHDELVRRQVAAAAQALPPDRLHSGGLGPQRSRSRAVASSTTGSSPMMTLFNGSNSTGRLRSPSTR